MGDCGLPAPSMPPVELAIVAGGSARWIVAGAGRWTVANSKGASSLHIFHRASAARDRSGRLPLLLRLPPLPLPPPALLTLQLVVLLLLKPARLQLLLLNNAA
jgi:hypothetical protein